MTAGILQDLSEKIYPDFEGGLYIVVAASLIAGGLLSIIALFASRLLKSHYHRREGLLRNQYQRILNKIIVNEKFSENSVSNAAFEFYMAELRLIIGNSKFCRQVLISQLMELKKQLTGNSSDALVHTYYALELFKQSLKKLKGFGWKWKVEGMHELGAMEYRESVPVVSGYLDSRNRILREECFMALVLLDEKPLSFLDHYKRDLSPWIELNIFHHLTKLDQRALPDFSKWFDHENITVRLFCINMARHFRHTSSLPALADLLYCSNATVVRITVQALGELQAHEYRGLVARIAKNVWYFENMAVAALRCLALIGDMHEDVKLICRYLTHPLYAVRFEAVSALRKMGADGDLALQVFNNANGGCLDNMLLHFSEPLLE